MKLQLSSPLKIPIKINQYFGANATNVYKQEGMPGHNGIDFYAPHATPVYACHDGRAYFQIDSAGGHGIVLITNQPFDYQDGQAYFKTIYWHLCDSTKEPQFKSPIQDFPWGKDVTRGDFIGYADNTGLSTGDHLHFGLKPVAQGESSNSWYNVEQNNGYFGAIDPAPYFDTGLLPDLAAPKPQLTWYQKFLVGLNAAGVEWKDGKWQYVPGFAGKRYQ